MNDEKRKENENRRVMDRLIYACLSYDSDVWCRLARIFAYEDSLRAYKLYERFMEIMNKEDSFDMAVWYGLRYF